jgi:hypothetical protein
MNINLKQLPAIFTQVMAVVYVAAGVFLILYDSESLPVNRTFRIIFGILLLVYGIFRSYRAYKSMTTKNE